MTIKKGDEILTLSEACKLLSCHPNTLRQWDNKGF
jgi:DNA-binding transcriptional MerR regulator